MAQVKKVREENGIPIYTAKRELSDRYIEKNLAKKQIEEHPSFIVDHSCDIYDEASGNMLARFRKKAMPIERLMAGVDNYKHSVAMSANRGDAAGGTKIRLDKDGKPSKMMMAENVESGNVGFLGASGMQRYCRMTAFGRDHFDKLQDGRPFVDYVDEKYKELCPKQHALQLNLANSFNPNYVLWDTSFSTITVNKNFRTAVHTDGGDYRDGFGNLFVYREGDWTGGYFTLPAWDIGVDMDSTDMLFVDVHQFHGNSPWTIDEEKGDVRFSFVLYLRENLHSCQAPTKEVHKAKMKYGSYQRL